MKKIKIGVHKKKENLNLGINSVYKYKW